MQIIDYSKNYLDKKVFIIEVDFAFQIKSTRFKDLLFWQPAHFIQFRNESVYIVVVPVIFTVIVKAVVV